MGNSSSYSDDDAFFHEVKTLGVRPKGPVATERDRNLATNLLYFVPVYFPKSDSQQLAWYIVVCKMPEESNDVPKLPELTGGSWRQPAAAGKVKKALVKMPGNSAQFDAYFRHHICYRPETAPSTTVPLSTHIIIPSYENGGALTSVKEQRLIPFLVYSGNEETGNEIVSFFNYINHELMLVETFIHHPTNIERYKKPYTKRSKLDGEETRNEAGDPKIDKETDEFIKSDIAQLVEAAYERIKLEIPVTPDRLDTGYISAI